MKHNDNPAPNELDRADSPLPAEEVRRRLPAVNLISDSQIRSEVISLTSEAPTYFWEVPAASPDSDYHHPACRRPHGLWAHTLMLIPPIVRLFPSKQAQGKLDEDDRDYAIAAALLHDQYKRGRSDAGADDTASDHDLLMAQTIEQESDLPAPVADAVASHMGPADWDYDGPAPETALQELVHEADMMASTPYGEMYISEPMPRELQDLGVSGADL